jgi:hypothetical protein
MSNEEHIEEMYHLAYLSGVFSEFSSEIIIERSKDPKIGFSELVQRVFEDFVEIGLIEEETHLFI